MWLNEYKSLILSNKAQRKTLFSIKTRYNFKVDTLQFVISESKNTLDKNGLTVCSNASYFSFIDLDIMDSYLHIFSKHKKTIFSKSDWKEEAALVFPPLKSRLSGFNNDPNVNITERAYLLDVFTLKVIYTNGKEETYTYDEKSKAFNKSN